MNTENLNIQLEDDGRNDVLEAAEPEARLLTAVLAQAIRDVKSVQRGQRGNVIRLDAHEWLTCMYEGPFSFIWVCGKLNLDYESLKQRLGFAND